MADISTPSRRRRLQTGLTVTPGSTCKKDALQDTQYEDRDALIAVEDSRLGRDPIEQNDDGKENDAPEALTPGKDIYQFARKRRKRFVRLVEEGQRILGGDETGSDDEDDEVDVAQTPSRSVKRVRVMEPGDTVATPTRGGKRISKTIPGSARKAAEEPSTPSNRARRTARDDTPGIPAPIRAARKRRVTKRIASVMDSGGDDSADEDDVDEDEEEDDDSDADDFLRKIAQREEDDEEDLAEGGGGYKLYFADLHTSNNATSNSTLAKLPMLEQKDLLQALENAPAKHEEDITLLNLLHEDQYRQWYFELKSGFNLLFYGYGSKLSLLDKFAETILTDAPGITVRGFFPSISIRKVVATIVDDVIKPTDAPPRNLQDQLSTITSYYQSPNNDDRLYLLIHNIDGESLRNPTAQSSLSLLAACPRIHVVASIDHINAPLLWDNVKTSRFNWVWHDVSTFRPYMTETTFEHTLMVQRGGEVNVRGVSYVLRSLASNATRIFRLLAEHQISAAQRDGAKKNGGGEQVGLAYHMYYHKALEHFLVGNELTFKTQLTEFRDHQIIQSRKAPDGTEILYIPLDAEALEGLLEGMGQR
ncbi:origin recognition complex subunit 2-domain-containing protein [Gaertneriomyces semiglobifer]|nr:origin recognition complex subunit 2-domain-containing protein [Gaertneriomyces semiglobifer]